MMRDFKLLMLGAMYENGGNTTHRFLDGHHQMFVYPFESQPGTKHVQDSMTSMFPVKYRWPSFLLEASPLEDYRAIIDEEGKVRARTPHVSKFRHMEFDLDDEERLKRYLELIEKSGRSRANNMAAFFRATFECWKNYNRTGKEVFHVGYSPIITVDAEKILEDLPQAHFLHVVRNPWSAYADTKKRPVPLSLANYMLGWTTCQYFALLNKEKYPDRMHIVRLEDVVENPAKTLGALCEELGLEKSDKLSTPTWNGTELETVYPWGTIKKATPAANKATADELSQAEKDEIRARTWQYLDAFDYKSFLESKALSR
ncbi:MAG TPA: sulfotransferase [Planktothrix sp.]|jgi:hypothetical protein